MPSTSSIARLRPDAPPAQQRAPETEQSLTTFNPDYDPTPEEQKLLVARTRLKASHALPAASFRVQEGGKTATVEFDHPDKARAGFLRGARDQQGRLGTNDAFRRLNKAHWPQSERSTAPASGVSITGAYQI